MNNQPQDMKKIAFRYFDGKTTPEEAEALHAFLKAEKNNRSLFKSWENDWFSSSAAPDPLLNRKWEKWKSAKQQTEELSLFIPQKKSIRKYALVAASVALIIIGGVWGVFHYRANLNEQFFTTEAPYGQKTKIMMPDSSIVWLNSGSTLTYSDKYGTKNREVHLLGEAYFEIEKGEKKFIVKTHGHSVTVKGTKFNVSAYPDDATLSTTLLQGSVELNYKNNIVAMLPGETVEINPETNTLSRRASACQTGSMWMENRLEYADIQLVDLLKKLSRTYAQPILMENDSLKNQSFCISINTQDKLPDVLKAISKITPVKIINKNDTIKLM